MSDDLLRRWLWRRLYDHEDLNPHFLGCQEAELKFKAYDGEYGCDTGCEYLRLEATIECEACEVKQRVDYGEFGDIASLVRALEAFEKGDKDPWYGNSEVYIYDR